MMFAPTKLSHVQYAPIFAPQETSASASALQRLHSLREQHDQYREKLQQQEEQLRLLKNQLSQTRTVVDLTLPGELKKAQREYLATIESHQRYDFEAAENNKNRAGLRAMLDSAGVLGMTEFLGGLLASIWPQVLFLLITLFIVGLISRETSKRLPLLSGHGLY